MVELGERFSLFPREKTVSFQTDAGYLLTFLSHLTLDSGDLLPPIPFQLATSVWRKPFHEAFTPFEPDAGYHVTQDDYDPVLRPLLRQRLLHDFSQRDIPGHPLVLSVVAQFGQAAWRGDPEVSGAAGHRFEEYHDLLPQLSFQVTANGLRFAAQPEPHALQNGELVYWRDFYPLDLGPLPTAGSPFPDAGLFIALPADWPAIAQLEGRFWLPSQRCDR